jgi:uncharacterized protein (DUF983 family)
MIEHDAPSGEHYRSRLNALGRGWRKRCPRCAEGGLYDGYLKVRAQCAVCDLALHHHRADDAPPYFTILIVGHVVIGGMLWLETSVHPPSWVHMAIWLPLTLALTLVLLPAVKGSLIGLQWALRMHGFDSPASDV